MNALLSVAHLTKKFNTVQVLDDISLDVEAGTIHGVIGPNGSGKTTLFNCISGIYRPEAGKILFQGEDVVRRKPHEIAKLGIARTFQLLRVFPGLSVLENLILAQTLHMKSTIFDAALHTPKSRRELQTMRERAEEIIEIIGLEAKAYNLAEEISIGQRRMLQIGIGMVSQPKLVLLDECAAGLDPANLEKIVELIRYMQSERGITILMIEHIMNVVMEVCRTLTVLDYGKVIFSGNPQDAQNDPKVIEAYLGTEGRGTVI